MSTTASEVRSALEGYHPGLLSGLVPAVPTGSELVVLSACETGLGRSEVGEGLLGLRRAFHTAGARDVISSLGSVDDEATRELVAELFEGIWTRGRSHVEALHEARLAMLACNRAANRGALPHSWGAFVNSGSSP